MKKVLLIESDLNVLDQIGEFLRQNNFEVIESSEGTSGIQKALEFLPDIILCDSETLTLSGFEIYNTLQQINSTAVIPFVFTMKKASGKNVRAVMNLGADDYIEKPFNQKELLNLIETRLEKQEKIIGIADEKFNTLMEYSTEGVLIIQNEKLSYVNSKFCELVKYSKRELIGMNLVNIIYKDDIHSVVDKISRMLNGLFKEMITEFRIICGNQDIIKLNFSGCLINVKGEKSIIGSIKLVKDSRLVSFTPLNCDINITQLEKEIVHLICEGKSNNEIANDLDISERTVEVHHANLLNKTACKNTAGLAIYAVKYGLYKVLV